MKVISLNAFDLLSANIFRKLFSALLRYRLQSFGTLSKSTGLLHIARYATSTFFEIYSKPISKSIQSNY